VNDHLASITRSFYSNAPSFGAKIAEKILTQPDLRSQWYLINLYILFIYVG
jgi:aspartate aminotransferase